MIVAPQIYISCTIQPEPATAFAVVRNIFVRVINKVVKFMKSQEQKVLYLSRSVVTNFDTPPPGKNNIEYTDSLQVLNRACNEFFIERKIIMTLESE
jgi:hypothetical protein